MFNRALKKLEVPHDENDAYAAEGSNRWGNRDIYPIIPEERTYTTASYLGYYCTSGFSPTSWTLGSSLLAYGLTAGQACGAVLVGSFIASVNAFLCGQAGSDHHVKSDHLICLFHDYLTNLLRSYAMLGRASLGLYGSYLNVLLPVFESLIYVSCFPNRIWCILMCCSSVYRATSVVKL